MRRAFTLVEVAFSLALFAICILLLLGLVPGLISGNQMSAQQLQAGELAQSILEQQRALPFEKLQPGSHSLSPLITPEGQYSPVLVIDGVPGEPNLNRIRRLTVSVSWSERRRKHSLSRELYVARVGR